MADQAKKRVACDCGRRFIIWEGEGHSLSFEKFDPAGYAAPVVFPDCLVENDNGVLSVVCTCGIWHELKEDDGRLIHERYFRAPAGYKAPEPAAGPGSETPAGPGTQTPVTDRAPAAGPASPAAGPGSESSPEATGDETTRKAARKAAGAKEPAGLLTRIARATKEAA